MRKQITWILGAVLAVTMLAACGGGDKKDAEAAAQPAAAAPAEVAAAPVGDASNGGKLYSTACVACHGPDAKGVTGLGKDLTASEWIGQQSDAQLVEFIKKGRDTSDALNTTGVAMPPKGGNPAMSEQEIADVVAYIRSIHQ